MTSDNTDALRQLMETFQLDADGNPPALHPDLDDTVFTSDSGVTFVHHPLVVAMYAPHLHAVYNHQYEVKMREVAEAEAVGDWHRYVFFHERPYRMGALVRALAHDDLTTSDYWQLIGDVWMDSENIYQNDLLWRAVLTSHRPGRTAMMDDDDLAFMADLPDTFTVYRGTAESRAPGLSWTTDPVKAQWFADRFSDLHRAPVVLSGTARKQDVIATFVGRGESEVVILPEDVE